MGPIDFTPAGQSISLVDFANPDYEAYPKFREALKAAQVVELEPGDAILIPSMWWHHVESLDDMNILINYWWRNTPAYMSTPVNVLQHGLWEFVNFPQSSALPGERFLTTMYLMPAKRIISIFPNRLEGF